MDAVFSIRDGIANVSELRSQRSRDAELGGAVTRIKTLQSQRFRSSYADLLENPAWSQAVRFFLYELYGDGDYAERDQQFGRIAGTLQSLFPQQVVATAVDLARLHAQTEALDHAMGRAWLEHGALAGNDAARYMAAWRSTGQREERKDQLQRVLALGDDLNRLTRLPGLRTMLRMMRGPANAAGMGDLQRFLETGFDTFAQLSKQDDGSAKFLATVGEREGRWMDLLFDADPVTCESWLNKALGHSH